MAGSPVSLERVARRAGKLKSVMKRLLRLAVKGGLLKEVGKEMYSPTEKGRKIFRRYH